MIPLLLYVPARLRDGLDAEEKGKRVAERAAPGSIRPKCLY
jgi:hypothetical protein